MLELLTGDDIYVSLTMLATVVDRPTFVLMEAGSDCACISPHVDGRRTNLIPCYGVGNLMRALTLADENGLAGVVAIRDSDWTDILEPRSHSENIVYTDLYDLDASILLKTDIGRRILLVFGDQERIATYCADIGIDSPIEAAIQIASEIGRLKLASQRHDLKLSLRLFPLHEIANAEFGTIPRDEMIRLAIQRSEDPGLTSSEISALLDEETIEPAPRLCVGHDLAAAIAYLIRESLGGANPSRGSILLTARSALSCPELWTLGFYQELQVWERRTGWPVWACAADVAGGTTHQHAQ